MLAGLHTEALAVCAATRTSSGGAGVAPAAPRGAPAGRIGGPPPPLPPVLTGHVSSLLPYLLDTSRPSFRTNWTRLVPPSVGLPLAPELWLLHARALHLTGRMEEALALLGEALARNLPSAEDEADAGAADALAPHFPG
jgi:hypothetical protein